jgi:vacuolar-type H+-ATPase subunit I/STV1
MTQVRGQVTGTGTGRVSTAPGRKVPGEQTAWVGWVVFGAVVMVLLGVYHLVAGLVALFRQSYFVAPHRDLLVSVSYDAWGWVHLIGGVVVMAAGVGLLTGATWARVVGVIVAMASAILNLAFLAASPVWAVMMIAMDVIVIYAITAHGSEIRNDV